MRKPLDIYIFSDLWSRDDSRGFAYFVIYPRASRLTGERAATILIVEIKTHSVHPSSSHGIYLAILVRGGVRHDVLI